MVSGLNHPLVGETLVSLRGSRGEWRRPLARWGGRPPEGTPEPAVRMVEGKGALGGGNSVNEGAEAG